MSNPRGSHAKIQLSARIEFSDEIFASLAGKMPRRPARVDVRKHLGLGPHAACGSHPRNSVHVRHMLEHSRNRRLPLALNDRIDRPVAVPQDFGRDEADAVPAAENETMGQAFSREFGQVNHFRNIGQIVDAETDGFGRKRRNLALEVPLAEDLEIQQPHLMPGPLDRPRHAFHAQRLKTEIDLGIEQCTGMNK